MPPSRTIRAVRLFATADRYRAWVGTRFHDLTVMSLIANRQVPQFWCNCVCGRKVVVTAMELARGRVRSCGSWQHKRRSSAARVKQRTGKR